MKHLKARFACWSALIAIPAVGHAVDWDFSFDGAARHDSNITNAQTADSTRSDNQVDIEGNVIARFDAGDWARMALTGAMHAVSFARFTGLDHLSLGVRAALEHKWGLGPYASWTRLAASATRLDYSNGIRDGSTRELSLSWGRRLSPRHELWLEYFGSRRGASAQPQEVPGVSGDAFSQNTRGLSLNTQVGMDESTALDLSYLLGRGDVVSSTLPGFRIFTASKAIVEDPVFGPGFYAYRLDGTTYALNAGLTRSLGRHASLGVGWQRQITHASGGNNYGKSLSSITWGYSY